MNRTAPQPADVPIPDIQPDFSAPFFQGFQVIASYILAGAMLVVCTPVEILGLSEERQNVIPAPAFAEINSSWDP